LVAYGIVKVVPTYQFGFWPVLGAIVAARLCFGLLDVIGGVISWHMVGRRVAVANWLARLRANQFPPREYANDDASTFFMRIHENNRLPEVMRFTAREAEVLLESSASQGRFVEARMNAAADAALEAYSPAGLCKK